MNTEDLASYQLGYADRLNKGSAPANIRRWYKSFRNGLSHRFRIYRPLISYVLTDTFTIQICLLICYEFPDDTRLNFFTDNSSPQYP